MEIDIIGDGIMATEKRSLTLNTDVTKKVEELAKGEDRSFSNMVQRILQEYFKMIKKNSGSGKRGDDTISYSSLKLGDSIED